jgi:hypothetical protein
MTYFKLFYLCLPFGSKDINKILIGLIKIRNIDCSLKFKVLMAFQCSVVFATKYVTITVLVLNIVADIIFLRVLQIQVQSHHIHHLTQVLILHVSNW